jgi:hypothetical protein
MKTSLLLFFVFIGLSLQAQHHEYHFKVAQIATYPAAKPMISIFRRHFNTDEEQQRVSVIFDKLTQEFRIVSSMPVTKEEFQAILNDYSYVLTDFQHLDQPAKSADHE